MQSQCNIVISPHYSLDTPRSSLATDLSVGLGASLDVMTVGRSLPAPHYSLMFQTILPAKPHQRPDVWLGPGETGGTQCLQEGEAGERQHPGGRHHSGESDPDDVTCIVPPGHRQGSLGRHSSSTRQYFMPAWAWSGLASLHHINISQTLTLTLTLYYNVFQVRKISQSQNISTILDKLGASELLDSCLLSSFKIFSTKHESFV